MLKLSLSGIILYTSGARHENAESEAPGAHFDHFCFQGRKMHKLNLLGLILYTSRAKEGKCSHGALEAKGIG